MNAKIKSQPGRPRSVEADRAIHKATLELLAEVGYDRMSIEAIAARAGVGKTTIYRRYTAKEALVAEAIDSRREEIEIPDTGNLWGDIDAIVDSATQMTLDPLGRQIVALIISTASSNLQFAQVYWTKYLQPRRQAFATVISRAKTRQEISPDLDADLVFDLISGIMLYGLVFPPATESYQAYVRRAIGLMLKI
jgi:AcrR family transcriptional regulator